MFADLPAKSVACIWHLLKDTGTATVRYGTRTLFWGRIITGLGMDYNLGLISLRAQFVPWHLSSSYLESKEAGKEAPQRVDMIPREEAR
jgi:hypothetical protein